MFSLDAVNLIRSWHWSMRSNQVWPAEYHSRRVSSGRWRIPLSCLRKHLHIWNIRLNPFDRRRFMQSSGDACRNHPSDFTGSIWASGMIPGHLTGVSTSRKSLVLKNSRTALRTRALVWRFRYKYWLSLFTLSGRYRLSCPEGILNQIFQGQPCQRVHALFQYMIYTHWWVCVLRVYGGLVLLLNQSQYSLRSHGIFLFFPFDVQRYYQYRNKFLCAWYQILRVCRPAALIRLSVPSMNLQGQLFLINLY